MLFFLYFLKNDYPFHRFAISVNRKIGNAVERNYIKRKMRELFRLNQDMIGNGQKYDLWVLIKRKFRKQDVGEIERLFLYSTRKIAGR